MSTHISPQETCLRELVHPDELQAVFGQPTRLQVGMGAGYTYREFGKIKTAFVHNGALVSRETAPPDAATQQRLHAYLEAYNTYFFKPGNNYRICNAHALFVLQDAEQAWHNWVVLYLAARNMPGRPTWALQPHPGLQMVSRGPRSAPAPRQAPTTPRHTHTPDVEAALAPSTPRSARAPGVEAAPSTPRRARSPVGSAALAPQLLCRQCWLDKHRTMPTHWALVWNEKDLLGHYGQRCPDTDPARTFTLVETNGIHATAVSFCRCKTRDGKRGAPQFQQLLAAGIFPGSVKDYKTGYTLGLLELYSRQRNQGKGSAYNFVLVLQRMADPFFAGAVPDIYHNFLAITRFHQHLELIMACGYAHGLDVALPGEADRPYPNRPSRYLGIQCAACPERGVNMPLIVNIPNYLRHLVSQHFMLDSNFKANLFFKRDDGSDTALTDGKMYFPQQSEFDAIAKTYVIPDEDKEVPCKAHIGSIRHQGQVKYGNTAVSGVVACACDHAVAGSFVDILNGEAFALGTVAQREQMKRTNSPLHPPESRSPTTMSYNSYCSFVVNMVKHAITLYPEETWLHELLAAAEGQIPADHINGHGPDCQAVWQAVYFGCQAHFHREMAEMIWAFLNPLGSSMRQMTGAARHDIINFVMDAWNTLKVLGQAELLATERLDALRLFELHMAVVADLSRQHASEVAGWSRLSRISTTDAKGKPRSVYQHETTRVLTVEDVLASMIAQEQDELRGDDVYRAKSSVAQWIHHGMKIQRQQVFLIALLNSHQEHPLQDTWETIKKLRDSLNFNLKKFRERQQEIYPRLTLSALDLDEPELTAIQLPSYRIKHGQQPTTSVDAKDLDSRLWDAEIELQCTEARSGILLVQDASLALSAVKKAWEMDYWGQAGITHSQQNLQKAELMKFFEISMYNNARGALIHLGHMPKDAVEPFPLLSLRDTQRKEMHLHRAKGDSRLFDGMAWYLQSGATVSRAAAASTLSSNNREQDSEKEEPWLLVGTQTLKRAGYTKSPRTPKRLKDIAPSDVVVDSSSLSASEVEDSDRVSPSKLARRHQAKRRKRKNTKVKKRDGWIWLESWTRAATMGNDAKLAEYKAESARVQWFRAKAEMYRWLEQYKCKHAV
ncbi:hypothetical protein B0H17DRAFT_1214249 [Mycena rosella]|uniref:CxC2-like cysteine cluster KDZ transposase-associated domain-containing protein n=1 Tax=Mycena rosella TaxID=1033263 RepID=A0AAD7CNF8_MYCRO|nr:hypothetical protein B0H17DRAFT_1214249 [Mycena rosella]